LVVPVHAGVVGFASAGDSGFEAVGLRNDEVGGDPAVGPAADGELVWISDTLRDSVVDDGHVVLIVLVAPIGVDGFGEIFSVSRGPAGLGRRTA